MDVRDTVEELTRIGIETRRSLDSLSDEKEREKTVLNHVKAFSEKELRTVDFQTGLEWFNVGKELSIYRHLSGKIIILDFFTYCCVNCMHILPDLDILEKQFSIADGLVIIGVHSAKFSNERHSAKLLSAIQRYNISHPVVNDPTLSTWQALGISCWPTLVMIGPAGELLAVFIGEGHREELTLFANVALTYFKSLDKISDHNIPLQPARRLLPVAGSANLLFPGKLEVFRNEHRETLVIADTGNNRILIADAKGNVEHVVGGANPGFKDGDFKSAKFNSPQGVCTLNDSAVYVADNENHAVRKIDLAKRIVSTVAGTGNQGHDYVGGKIGKDQVLSSPWDVAVYKHEQENDVVPVLLLANAGTHQIWALFLEDTVWWKNREYKAGTCIAIVGSGKEENRNNSYPHAAGLAQPSGLIVLQEKKIAFFADSESSAIRSIDLRNGQVFAVCGANRNPTDLHDYGDRDGARYAAKLQHPLGITWHAKENVLYVADTYNHKIKRVDVTTGYCKTVYGDSSPSQAFSFDEPSGIATSTMDDDLLYVADTNNHGVKVIDMQREIIATLPIRVPTDDVHNSFEHIHFFDTSVNEKGGEVSISFSVSFLERDLKLNRDAPQKWSVDSSTSGTGWTAAATSGELSNPIRINVREGNRTHEVRLILDIVACRITECLPKKLFAVYHVHQEPNAPSLVMERKELIVE